MDASLLGVSLNPLALLVPGLAIGAVVYILLRDWLKTRGRLRTKAWCATMNRLASTGWSTRWLMLMSHATYPT